VGQPDWSPDREVSRIQHFFPANQVQGILLKIHHILTSGGLIVIDDGILDEERCQAEQVLLSAVSLVNSASEGEFYTFSEYRSC
jgi:hypothetical protein